MKCTEARPLFPLYLDSALTGAEMHALSAHMSACPECQSEYKEMEKTRLLVWMRPVSGSLRVGRKPAPTDLALRLRLAISHERSRSWRGMFERYLVRVENSLNALMFPATAGILTAVIFFGTLIGFFNLPAAASSDVLPSVYMPARLQPPQTAMSAAADIDLNIEEAVIIQAYIDSTGRVQDYQIVSGPDGDEVRSQLNRALLFTTFSPAYAFGQPVAGTAFISFSHVNVKM